MVSSIYIAKEVSQVCISVTPCQCPIVIRTQSTIDCWMCKCENFTQSLSLMCTDYTCTCICICNRFMFMPVVNQIFHHSCGHYIYMYLSTHLKFKYNHGLSCFSITNICLYTSGQIYHTQILCWR